MALDTYSQLSGYHPNTQFRYHGSCPLPILNHLILLPFQSFNHSQVKFTGKGFKSTSLAPAPSIIYCTWNLIGAHHMLND